MPAIRHILIFISCRDSSVVRSQRFSGASDFAHLPPHLLSNAVRTSTEAMSRGSQVVGLILKGIETLAALGDLVDILAHNTDRVIDLL